MKLEIFNWFPWHVPGSREVSPAQLLASCTRLNKDDVEMAEEICWSEIGWFETHVVLCYVWQLAMYAEWMEKLQVVTACLIISLHLWRCISGAFYCSGFPAAGVGGESLWEAWSFFQRLAKSSSLDSSHSKACKSLLLMNNILTVSISVRSQRCDSGCCCCCCNPLMAQRSWSHSTHCLSPPMP